jgi:hypothetical protein
MAQAPPLDSDLPRQDLGTYQEDGEGVRITPRRALREADGRERTSVIAERLARRVRELFGRLDRMSR